VIQAAMPGASLAAIGASLHGRSGKTLLARALVDFFILCGGKPYIFYTDAVERRLQALFPAAARIVDLTVVRDQMELFDTLAKRSPQMRVVDLTHQSLTKFFQLLRNTDFIFEARSHDIIPAIFYIPDDKADSFEAGVVLRDNFADCRFIVVENTFMKEPKRNVCQDPAYKALRAHKRRFVMPKLADSVIAALEDRDLSIADFMRQPISPSEETQAPNSLPPDILAELRVWVFGMFQEIHRVISGPAIDDGPLDDTTGRPWAADLENWGPAVNVSGPNNVGRRQMILNRLLLLGKP